MTTLESLREKIKMGEIDNYFGVPPKVTRSINETISMMRDELPRSTILGIGPLQAAYRKELRLLSEFPNQFERLLNEFGGDVPHDVRDRCDVKCNGWRRMCNYSVPEIVYHYVASTNVGSPPTPKWGQLWLRLGKL